jgi:Tol biopolymer transport system component
MRIIPLLDGPVRNVFTETSINAAWSRDGSRALYHTWNPGDPVFVADGDGTNSLEILRADSGMHQHYPIWSSDERWIYFNRGRESYGGIDLWRVRPDGSGLEQLTFDQRGVAYPTPIDERTVLYVASNTEGAGPWLWAVDVETKRSQRVSIGLEEYRTVSASADGRRLVATIAHPEANLWSVPILGRVAEESDVQPYSLPAVRALAPRFAGGALFFLSSRGTGDGLWRFRDGQLTEIWSGSEAALLEAPSVSPNGKSVAIVLRGGDGRQLHLMNSDGSNLRAVAEGIDVRGAASWSPDGERIAVGGKDATGLGLFVIPSTGDPPERITVGDAMNPIWSPDGDLIVYAGKQVGPYSPLLAVYPDGRPAEFPDIPEVSARGERFRFLPDGSGLVYMRGVAGTLDFWLIDLSTMEHRRLTELAQDARMRTFDITPDGKTIVFDRQRDNSEIVLIELADNSTIE